MNGTELTRPILSLKNLRNWTVPLPPLSPLLLSPSIKSSETSIIVGRIRAPIQCSPLWRSPNRSTKPPTSTVHVVSCVVVLCSHRRVVDSCYKSSVIVGFSSKPKNLGQNLTVKPFVLLDFHSYRLLLRSNLGATASAVIGNAGAKNNWRFHNATDSCLLNLFIPTNHPKVQLLFLIFFDCAIDLSIWRC